MRFLTGDECGLLKEYVPEIAHKKLAKEEADHSNSNSKPDIIRPVHYDVAKINNSHGIQRVDPNETQTRARGVVAMTFYGATSEEQQQPFSYAALRANGSVELWQAQVPEGDNKKKFARHQRLSLSGNVFETSKATQSSSSSSSSGIPNVPVKPLALANVGVGGGRLCACDSHGNIVILKTDPSDIHKPVSVVQQFEAFSNTPDNITLTYTKGNVINTQLASAMAVSGASRVAIGGRERDVRLFDLETGGTPIWKAKNLPPDPQTLLQQPIWPSAMTFINNNNNYYHPLESNLLAVGTAFGQLRLYDVRTNPAAESITRRPIRYTPEQFMEHRITAICQVSDQQVLVGDTTGDIHALDLRKQGGGNLNGQHGNKQLEGSDSLGRYVGPAGSIRQLVKHERLPIVAAVGCDRMLRTYNTQTQKAIDCVYLKQRLNCVLACREGHTDDFAAEDDFDGAVGGSRGGGTNGSDLDIDQEDVVKDYVDSSDDDDSDDDDDDDGAVVEKKRDSPQAMDRSDGNANESSSENENHVDNNDEDASESESSSSGCEEAEKRSSDDEPESGSEDDSSEDEAPKKRRKR